MYESPIKQMTTEMQFMYENECMKVVQGCGFDVNKEELAKALAYDRGQYEKGYSDGFNANRWILCSERLPENERAVLVSDGYFTYIDWWDKEAEQFGRYKSILAWQPLPEPYKENEHEKR